MLMVLYPMYFIIIASISDPDATYAGKVIFLPKDISFESYQRILEDNRIWTGYRNTLIYTVTGTSMAVITSLMAGYSFSRRDFMGRKIFIKIFVFTMYFRGGLIPTYLVVRNIGLLNTPWIMMIWSSVQVFNILITRSFLENSIPFEMYEAAEMDGCTDLRFFIAIVLPLSKAIIAVLTVYYAATYWNSYFFGLIFLSSKELFPLQLFLRDILISSQMLENVDMDPESLESLRRIAGTIKYGVIIVSIIPMMILYPFVQKYFVTGVMIGSIKG